MLLKRSLLGYVPIVWHAGHIRALQSLRTIIKMASSSSTKSAFVSVKWLAGEMAKTSSSVRVLDASWHLPMTGRSGPAEYKTEHIAGALHFDIDECRDKTVDTDHMLTTRTEFEVYVGARGIDNSTHVVLYDKNERLGLFSAPRVWWMFRVWGHTSISILNGGLPKWKAEGQPVTSVIPKVTAKKFKANYQSKLVKTMKDVEENITNATFQLIDARPPGRYNGTEPEPREGTQPGHIVGAISLPFPKTLNLETKTAKSPTEIRKVFADANISLDRPIVAMCGSGVSACALVLAAFECGKKDVPVYDGSWTEWYLHGKQEYMVDCPDPKKSSKK